MGYSLKLIMSIAEHKFGKNDKKAIDKYIAEFNPNDPNFAEDIKNYNLSVNSENAKLAENAFRYRILQDVRYMRIVYGRSIYDITSSAKELNETVEKDPYRIKTTFSNEPIKYDGKRKYLLHSQEMQQKYGFHHKTDNVVAVLKDLCGRENANECYKSYFKTLFSATYCMATDKKTDAMELFTDFDNFMTEILKTEIAPLKENAIDVKSVTHGGLKGKELVDFLNGYANLFENDEIVGKVNDKTSAKEAVKNK